VPVSKNRRKDGTKAPKPVKRKSRKTEASPALLPEDLPPRVTMEKMMASLQRSLLADDLLDEAEADPLHAAQDVMYDAWECGTKRERIALAKQALGISDLCADAWLLLAEDEAKGIVETRATLEKAVAAGEEVVRHALGEDAFEEEEGNFWGILETRPYMRARAALAECLWEMGDRDEAVAHWRDMLRLCPNDNMGLRHVLAPKLLHMNLFEATRELLDDYEEPHFAEWSYTDALLKFKQGGATSGAGKALAAAIRHNPHVPATLLGETRLPKQPPPHDALGSKDEAVLYVLSSLETWTSTKGALTWLSETAKNTL
jgi:tetratricopeptide (TPR) repeat protein